MKISPSISFNGNCIEAIALYEKAFNGKVEISRFKDAPPEDDYQAYRASEGTENFIFHAELEISGIVILLSDMPPQYPVRVGNNITIALEFDDTNAAKAAFDVLKEGGKVETDFAEAFWDKSFGSLTDKFGIHWYING
jgi:PhnB protein